MGGYWFLKDWIYSSRAASASSLPLIYSSAWRPLCTSIGLVLNDCPLMRACGKPSMKRDMIFLSVLSYVLWIDLVILFVLEWGSCRASSSAWYWGAIVLAKSWAALLAFLDLGHAPLKCPL